MSSGTLPRIEFVGLVRGLFSCRPGGKASRYENERFATGRSRLLPVAANRYQQKQQRESGKSLHLNPTVEFRFRVFSGAGSLLPVFAPAKEKKGRSDKYQTGQDLLALSQLRCHTATVETHPDSGLS